MRRKTNNTDFMKVLSEYMTAKRKEQSLRLSLSARRIGVKHETLMRWEICETGITIVNFVKWCEALNLVPGVVITEVLEKISTRKEIEEILKK